MCHVTGKQLKMLSHETVHQNHIKLVATENALNSQKCLITLYIVGWVIKVNVTMEVIPQFFPVQSTKSVTRYIEPEDQWSCKCSPDILA